MYHAVVKSWDYIGFKNRLDAALGSRTQTEIARKIGVAANQISNWKNSSTGEIPRADQVERLADEINVRPGWLAWGEEPRTYNQGSEAAPALQEIIDTYFSIPISRAVLELTAKGLREGAGKTEHAPMTSPSVKPIESKPKRVNRRDELPVFPIVKSGTKGAIKIPRFEAVAAGFGEDLEQSEEVTYVRELPDYRGVHSILVRGDSMEDTLRAGDLILVRYFGESGINLPARGDNPKNSKRQLQASVPDDDLFIFSLNDAPATVKRIQYQGDLDWKLIIRADNPEYRIHAMDAKDKIVFYGRVIGIGGRVPDWGKKK